MVDPEHDAHNMLNRAPLEVCIAEKLDHLRVNATEHLQNVGVYPYNDSDDDPDGDGIDPSDREDLLHRDPDDYPSHVQETTPAAMKATTTTMRAAMATALTTDSTTPTSSRRSPPFNCPPLIFSVQPPTAALLCQVPDAALSYYSFRILYR